MTEQATQEQDKGNFQEIVEHAKQQSDKPETQVKNTDKEKNGSDYAPPVDLSGLDEDSRNAIEGRFLHLSGLMKRQNTKWESKYNNDVGQWRTIASDQSRKIEELTSNVSAVVDHVQGNSFQSAEAQILTQLKDANAKGDTDAFLELNSKLTEVKAKKVAWEERQREQKTKQKEKPKQEEQIQQPRIYSADEALQFAVESGDLTQNEGNAFKSWMDEKDENNRPVRPWAYTQDPLHPSKEYQDALAELRSVFGSTRYENLDLAQKLTEIDRRMGIARNSGSQVVLGGNLTTARKSSKLSLTPEMETVAKRIKLAGPGKSDAEQLEAYRIQLATTKGGRK